MSILIKPPITTNYDLGPNAPKGPHIARCYHILEQMDVEMPKYLEPNETEKMNTSEFFFGLRGDDGELYRVKTWQLRTSTSPKSNFWKFLTSWMGREPEFGWDFVELVGEGAQITVDHKTNKDGTKEYPVIVSIAPVMPELRDKIPPLEAFDKPEDPDQPTAPTPAPGPTQPQPAESTAPQQPYNPEIYTHESASE